MLGIQKIAFFTIWWDFNCKMMTSALYRMAMNSTLNHKANSLTCV